MQNKRPFTTEELHHILNWQQENRSPQSIFGFHDYGNKPIPNDIFSQIFPRIPSPPPYDQNAIEETYQSLRNQAHPDKQNNTDLANQVSQLLEDMREYLLFTCKSLTTIDQTNPFYAYYYLGVIPEETTPEQFENILLRIYAYRTEPEKNYHHIQTLLSHLQTLININPDLISHAGDPRSSDIGNKSIVYCAAQWNEAKFFEWLLHDYGDRINVLTKTAFGMSPFDIALRKHHIDVLRVIQAHYNEAWMKDQFDISLNSREYVDSVIACYEKIFLNTPLNYQEWAARNPYLLPSLIRLGKINPQDGDQLLRKRIIGCPDLYLSLDTQHRCDSYMIIATLSQDCSAKIINNLPLSTLDPSFVSALADFWPQLRDAVEHVHHAKGIAYSNSPSYWLFKHMMIALCIVLAIALLSFYFWPSIVLCSTSVQFLFALSVGAPSLVVSLLSPLICYRYLTQTYPETQKINQIRIENNFFQPAENNSLTLLAPAVKQRTPGL